MLWVFALAVSIVPADPRPALVELQLAGRPGEALARAEHELAERPATARQIGLDYLRGHLLDRLGRREDSAAAFGLALARTPRLAAYSRYRLALEQERLDHPEVAAGLIANVVASDPRSPLLPAAVRLFTRTLERGGDCRLLQPVALESFAPPERRALQVARAECSLRAGERDLGRALLEAVLEEMRDDEWARAAAEQLAALGAPPQGHRQVLLGLTFHQHREHGRALLHLRRALGGPLAVPARDAFEARYAIARSQFLEGHYAPAAGVFGTLAEGAPTAEDRARALYQQGRSFELLGGWRMAVASFARAYQASPDGEWAAAALLAGCRLQARGGAEEEARRTWAQLAARSEWREPAARGALFLATSDLVRGRGERAADLLAAAERGGAEERLEAAYWRGRQAELRRELPGALDAYLAVLRADPWHPFAQAARRRLASGPLAPLAAATARRLAVSRRGEDLLDAWRLLGDASPLARSARIRLARALGADPETAPFVRLAQVPVARWPLWGEPARTAEEMLLALGLWGEGAPAVAARFPPGSPALAATGSRALALAGELRRSIELAQALRARTPARVPLVAQPELRRLLYPLPWEDRLRRESRQRVLDPLLLAAVLREESRFDPWAITAAAHGLAQIDLGRARQLAAGTDIAAVQPEDLHRPEVSIPLGAAYLAALLRAAGGSPYVAVAAYRAGAPQARLWRSYCYSGEPEEYLTKVGFKETRTYLSRVLASWAQYRELYPPAAQ